MVSVMVASATRSIEAIVAAGGETVRPVDESVTEKLAWLRDPAGNVLGIYQQPGLAETEVAPASGHP
jgi:predicted enzyme related to lactoylglutathione lyase